MKGKNSTTIIVILIEQIFATASIDNATDMILQKTIRAEFADCTVITVAHRIPTVMDCTMILSVSDGKLHITSTLGYRINVPYLFEHPNPLHVCGCLPLY